MKWLCRNNASKVPRATCPPQAEVLKAGIQADYDVKLHQGKFYELFYADPLERVSGPNS